MKPLRKSVKTKTNSNFAVNVAEMLKEATSHFWYLTNLIFQLSVLFNMATECNKN